MTTLHTVRGCTGDRFQTRLFSPWIQLCLKLPSGALSYEPINSVSAKACLRRILSLIDVSRKTTHKWGKQFSFP